MNTFCGAFAPVHPPAAEFRVADQNLRFPAPENCLSQLAEVPEVLERTAWGGIHGIRIS